MKISTDPNQNTVKGAGCLVLFALPFAAVGVVCFGIVGRTVWRSFEMQSWIEVPAEIQSVHLAASQGDDSTTYKVEATYTYTIEGNTYTGERVGLIGGSDNIGSYHQDLYATLEAARARGETYPAWVDPANHAEAVLDRNLRWGMLAFLGLFAFVFGGVGFGLIAAGIVGAFKLRRVAKLKAEKPKQPWNWSEQWQGGKISSRRTRGLLFASSFALLWNLLSAPLLFIVPQEIEKKNYGAALGLLFPLVGLFLVGWAVYELLKWRRYGRTVFEMAKVPGVIGGPLAGVVRLPVVLQPEQGFTVTLSAVEKRTSGSGKHRRTVETNLWQQQKRIRAEGLRTSLEGTVIPIAFAIPYDARETDMEDPEHQFVWVLHVEAEVEGVDLDESFEVPVFTTDDSSPHYELADSKLAELEVTPPIQLVIDRLGGHQGLTAEGANRYEVPVFARSGSRLVPLTITGVLALATGLVAGAGGPWQLALGLAVAGVFFGFCGLWAWLTVHTIEVRPGRIELGGGMMGFAKTRIFQADEVAALEPATNVEVNGRPRWHLQVRTSGGEKIAAFRGTADLLEIQTLGKEIEGILRAKPF